MASFHHHRLKFGTSGNHESFYDRSALIFDSNVLDEFRNFVVVTANFHLYDFSSFHVKIVSIILVLLTRFLSLSRLSRRQRVMNLSARKICLPQKMIYES